MKSISKHITLCSVLAMAMLGVVPLRAGEAGKQFAEDLKQAHGWSTWPDDKLLALTANISFSDAMAPMQGRVIMTPDFASVRYEGSDGLVAIYKDGQAWVLEGQDMPGAHFLLPTVSYFIGAPFKLSDPGVNLDLMPEPLPMKAQQCPAAKVTFGEDVGDAPDDWYIAYQNPESGLLDGLAYIVTYFKSVEEAEKTPKMIVYADYTAVGDSEVQISRDWKFYHWNREEGPHGEVVYHQTLSEPEWLDADKKLFEITQGATNVTPDHMKN
jgi:hypothetical protein